jgi:hypothetical protein
MAETLTIPDGTRVVHWTLTSDSVPRDILAAALGSREMPRDVTLLRRAIATVLPKALLRFTAHEKAVCVVDERKGADGNSYTVNATLEPFRPILTDANSLGFSCVAGLIDGPTGDAIRVALQHVLAHADAGEVGRMLISAIASKGGAPIGQKGGAYLLPVDAAGWWAGVTCKLDPHVDCHSMAIVPDADATAAVVSIVARRLATEASDIAKDGSQRASAAARTEKLRAALGDAVTILDNQATAISIADQLAQLADMAAREIADESI